MLFEGWHVMRFPLLLFPIPPTVTGYRLFLLRTTEAAGDTVQKVSVSFPGPRPRICEPARGGQRLENSSMHAGELSVTVSSEKTFSYR